MNRGDPKTRHAKRGSGNHPYRRPVAPKQSRARNNNDRASRPKAKDDANDKTLCYKCGGYGHMQRTCKATPQEVENYHKGRKAEANVVEANGNKFLETPDFVAQMEE